MNNYDLYQKNHKLAKAMIERVPNGMERELSKSGIRENMTSGYFRKGADKLSKYKLSYRHEADLKDTLRYSLQALEDSYMQSLYAKRRQQRG